MVVPWESEEENALRETLPPKADPNLERWGLVVGLLVGLGISLKNGLRGWVNIYYGNEEYWTRVCWNWIGAVVLLGLVAFCVWFLVCRRPRDFEGDLFPCAYAIIWIVLIQQNIIAQLITGPVTKWNWAEQIFSVYYLILFVITGVTVHRYNSIRKAQRALKQSARSVSFT